MTIVSLHSAYGWPTDGRHTAPLLSCPKGPEKDVSDGNDWPTGALPRESRWQVGNLPPRTGATQRQGTCISVKLGMVWGTTALVVLYKC